MLHISRQNREDIFLKSLPRPIPPTKLLQTLDRLLGKAAANRLRGHAADNSIGRHILCHHRPRTDDGAITDRHAGQNHRFITDPDVIADADVPFVIPGIGYPLDVQPPLLINCLLYTSPSPRDA